MYRRGGGDAMLLLPRGTLLLPLQEIALFVAFRIVLLMSLLRIRPALELLDRRHKVLVRVDKRAGCRHLRLGRGKNRRAVLPLLLLGEVVEAGKLGEQVVVGEHRWVVLDRDCLHVAVPSADGAVAWAYLRHVPRVGGRGCVAATVVVLGVCGCTTCRACFIRRRRFRRPARHCPYLPAGVAHHGRAHARQGVELPLGLPESSQGKESNLSPARARPAHEREGVQMVEVGADRHTSG